MVVRTDAAPVAQGPARHPGVPAPEARGAFTRYVRALDPGREPTTEAFDELWRGLRSALRHELRKRSLWSGPPSFLGLVGWPSWLAERGTESALDELSADCYAFLFIERLPRLRAQLEVKPNVEGLVFLYLRNYLHDRQKHHDPLGFRIFEVLRSGVRSAVDDSELRVLSGDRRIGNGTLLAAVAAGEAGQADPEEAAEPAALRPIVERWNDELLPDLVTATGAQRQPLLERLRRCLLDLEVAGVRSFRFKDLIDPLKNDVRNRWAALYDLGEGESAPADDAAGLAAAVRLFPPAASEVEERDSFRQLVGCVAQLMERLGAPGHTRHYLCTLFGFLRTWAGGEGPESLPSNRRLSGLLRIPRDRLPGLYETLRRLIGQCRAATSGRVAVIDPRGRAATPGDPG